MKSIEFWFDFASNYSYLSVMRIVSRGIDVAWRPFLLGPIFRSFGWSNSPFVLQKEKGEYTWRDMARQCAKYGVPWQMPSEFPRLGVLPLRIMLVAEGKPWAGDFARRVMLRNFDFRGADLLRLRRDVLGQRSPGRRLGLCVGSHAFDDRPARLNRTSSSTR